MTISRSRFLGQSIANSKLAHFWLVDRCGSARAIASRYSSLYQTSKLFLICIRRVNLVLPAMQSGQNFPFFLAN